MSDFRARFLRRLRYEIFSFALVASVPVAIALVFPYEAVGFHAKERAVAPVADCAFVSLDAAAEHEALAAARTAWQVDVKGVRGLRVDLSTGDLPPVPMRPVIRRRLTRAPEAGTAEYVPNVLPPTVGAAAPGDIATAADKPAESKQAFSKEDLLKID